MRGDADILDEGMEAEGGAETRLNAVPVLWRSLCASSALEVERMAGLREPTNAGERRCSPTSETDASGGTPCLAVFVSTPHSLSPPCPSL